MLVITRKINQAVTIGRSVRIMVLGLEGERVRLGIEAPPELPIRRAELSAVGKHAAQADISQDAGANPDTFRCGG